MPAKSKANKLEWGQCVNCGRIISYREFDKHLLDCGKQQHEAAYGWLRNQILHAKISPDQVKPDAGIHLPASATASLIFLSPATMKLGSFSIGQPVVVNGNHVYKAWPCDTLWPARVGLGEHIRRRLGVEAGGMVTLENLTHTVHAAAAVTLTCREKNEFLASEEFVKYVKFISDGAYITLGSVLEVKYFGDRVQLDIVDIRGPELADSHPDAQTAGSMDAETVESTSLRRRGPEALDADIQGDCDRVGQQLDLLNLSASLGDGDTSIAEDNSTSGDASLDHSRDASIAGDTSLSHSTPVKQTQHNTSMFHTPTTSTTQSPNTQKHFFKMTSRTSLQIETGEAKEKKESKGARLDEVGGLQTQIDMLREMLELPLKHHSVTTQLGVSMPRGVLLYGASGTGKSLLAEAMCNHLQLQTLIVHPADLWTRDQGQAESRFRELFAEAKTKAPSVIIINDLESICSRKSSSQSEAERRLVACLVALMDNIQQTSRVVVMATTTRPEGIDASLRRPGRLDREIEFSAPNVAQRLQILRCLVSRVAHDLSEGELAAVAERTHGFVGADLAALCREAGLHAMKRYAESLVRHDTTQQSDNSNPIVTSSGDSEAIVTSSGDSNPIVTSSGSSEAIVTSSADSETIVTSQDSCDAIVTSLDLRAALKVVQPSAMREVAVDVPKVLWSDIGGQASLKHKLRQAVEWPLKHADTFTRLGIEPPRGVLMYGPPGCSKTMIAKALATESGLNFLSIKGPELFSKWVGESERGVRDVFRKARAAAPSIIFFDEIDALTTERGGSGSNNVSERVLAQLLTEMDGVEKLEDVTIVAATNRPDMIDKALLRPGRIDRIVYVPLPDRDTRGDIFTIRMRTMPVTQDVGVAALVDQTHNYSGAEIVAVCHEAALSAMEEDIDAKVITSRHFDAALNIVKPRTTQKAITYYEQFHNQNMTFAIS